MLTKYIVENIIKYYMIDHVTINIYLYKLTHIYIHIYIYIYIYIFIKYNTN